MNKNYQKGVRYERQLVNEARAEGKIAFRSAGSHSPIDLAIIDTKNKQIQFIQCKTGKAPTTKAEKQFKDLDDEYLVKFEVKKK